MLKCETIYIWAILIHFRWLCQFTGGYLVDNMSPNTGSCGCRNDRHKLKTTAEIHLGKQRACRKCFRDTMLKLGQKEGQGIRIIIGLLLCLLCTQLPKCVACNREHDQYEYSTNDHSMQKDHAVGSQCPPVSWQNSVSTADMWVSIVMGVPQNRWF